MKNTKLTLLLTLSCGMVVGPVAAEAQTRLQSNPAQLNFFFTAGSVSNAADSGNPVNFSVTTPGINFTATTQTFSGANTSWLSNSSVSGSTTSQPIKVSVNAGNLPIGKYLGIITLKFTGNYAPLTVPVWVTVHGAFHVIPGFTLNGFGFTSQPTFDFTQGQPTGCEIGDSSAACTAGIDDLDGDPSGTSVNLSTVTLDGGHWLSILGPTMMNTPATTVFSIDPSQVPAGIGSATGYVVVDGGSRGVDYVTVTVPAVAASGFPGITAFLTAVPPRKLAIPYLDGGNGSLTSIRVVNTGTMAANYTVTFWRTDPNTGLGAPLFVPLANGGQTSQVTGTVYPGAMDQIDTSTTASNEAFGWAELSTAGSLAGYGILSESGSNQVSVPSEFVEAGIPISLASRTVVMPFDNTTGELTQVLVVNPGSSPTSVTMNFFDTSGNVLLGGTKYLILGGYNQTLLSLPDQYPQTSGIAGTIQLAAQTAISLVGVRFDQGGAFSYLPALPVLPWQPTSSLPLIAYGGGWQSTVMMLNPTSSIDSPSLSAYTGDVTGGDPLDFGFLGHPNTNPLTANIPSFGVSTLQTSSSSSNTSVVWLLASELGLNGPAFTNGLALLRADAGGLVGTFSTNLPLAPAFQSCAVFPFDNTGGLESLLFLSNADISGSANFTFQVSDESGNPLSTPSPVSLGAHGQTSIVFSAGARGTIGVSAIGHGFYGSLFRFISGGMFTSMPAFPGQVNTSTSTGVSSCAFSH